MDGISPDDPSAVWGSYGLTQSPYDTSPLRRFGPLSIDIFHGRTSEVQLLKRTIRASSSSRQVISGPIGVGKTSLGNYVTWELCTKREGSKYLTLNTEIRTDAQWTPNHFLMELLAHISHSDEIFGWSDNYALKSIHEIRELVSVTKDQARSASLGPVGGGIGTTRNIPSEITNAHAQHLISSFLSELAAEEKELIILIDNLEALNPEGLSKMLLSLRDFFQSEGLHTILIGTHAILSAIDRHGQVSSVFSTPLLLSTLSADEFVELLQKRCRSLAVPGSKYIQPYDKDTVRALYQIFQNIRYVFKILEDATFQLREYAPLPITMERVRVIQERERKRLESELTETQSRILRVLLEEKQALKMGDLAQKAKIQSTNIRKSIDPLVERGLLVIEQHPSDKRSQLVKVPENSYLRIQFATDASQTKLTNS